MGGPAKFSSSKAPVPKLVLVGGRDDTNPPVPPPPPILVSSARGPMPPPPSPERPATHRERIAQQREAGPKQFQAIPGKNILHTAVWNAW